MQVDQDCINMNFKSRLDECINSIAKKEGYATYKVNKENISTDGGNYLGLLSQIDIQGETANGYKETAIFCKTMTPGAKIEYLSIQNVYKVELFAYKELSKVINEIQDEAQIPHGEKFNMVKCFDESHESALLLDNMNKKGYKTWFRMDIVSFEMAEVCIKQLARFHGISFALKELRPNFYDKIKSIRTPLIFHSDEWKDFEEKFFNIGMDHLDDGMRVKVGDKIRKILGECSTYLTDTTSQYTLCHGDYRPNNILIKEKNGQLADAIVVDYQIMYFGCPLIDFFYFIYMATDNDFRKIHMENLKNLYYDSLGIYLANFNISVQSVFPRKLYEKLYKEKRNYGLITTVFFCPFVFVAEGGEAPDVTKDCLKNIDFKLDGKYKEILDGTIREFIELGVL